MHIAKSRGVHMVKIYKSNKGKLVLYLPFDVISALKLKENDEVDFFRMPNNAFLFAKKSDVTGLLLGAPQKLQDKQPEAQVSGIAAHLQPSDDEIAVLKKIDTIRYQNRTQENTLKILNEGEKKTLQRLMSDGFLARFKGQDGKEHFSIPKNIYDRFLMRKKPVAKGEPYNFSVPVAPRQQQSDSEGIAALEKNGFIVLQTEAEAGKISLDLEQSIRRGQVLGTRAFNKKFYIVLRQYFDRYSQPILKKLREKSCRASDLAKEIPMSEDGARSILYLLSENGDVSEKKRDVFTIA